ncbi:MAG: Sua5/YciO/YrdC/YwlC family protein [Thermodesulfovibrio sp.]|nr:Sua5/YciO/YrdC/YwlC family protein [Thermodesulfovibrio sp.]
MLPYTPLHYLLFYYPEKDNHKACHFEALVMTSGNISEEPIITKNEEVFEKLKTVADAFLIHDRDIFMRVDDSVAKEFEGKVYFIRRARGFVPKAINIKEELPEVLGVGADLKNTFTLIKSNYAIISQHIGDMENVETLNFFEEVFENLKSVYRVEPTALGYDLHPGYYSTAWAKEYSERKGIPSFALQHHYCHVTSLMAEYGLNELFGIAFDGTGYGLDGKIWGSEFLYCSIKDFKRLAHLDWITLPGGERAIKECSRVALSLIDEVFGEDIELIKKLPLGGVLEEQKIKQILKLKRIPQFSPLSCGMGRVFDAVASLLGICHYNTFEAEAAIAVESLVGVREFSKKFSYNFKIINTETMVIDYRPMIKDIVNDILNGRSQSEISWKFHNTIIKMILEVIEILKEILNFEVVGLSGGVFQNEYILRETVKALRKINLKPLIHEKTPANDACISLGQAYIVGKRIKS